MKFSIAVNVDEQTVSIDVQHDNRFVFDEFPVSMLSEPDGRKFIAARLWQWRRDLRHPAQIRRTQ